MGEGSSKDTNSAPELGEEGDSQQEAGHPGIQRQERAWCGVRRTTEEPEQVGTGEREPGPWLAWWLPSLGSRAGNGPQPRAGSEERCRPLDLSLSLDPHHGAQLSHFETRGAVVGIKKM